MKRRIIAVCLLATIVSLVQSPGESVDSNHLGTLASQARRKGDLLGEATYLCQAAALDGAKYQKKCSQAKEDAEKMLAQFQADLNMGRSELQQADYAGALRDLRKISFGPSKTEAQDLITQARLAMGGPEGEQANREALEAARTAYNGGDFESAEAQAKRVRSSALQPAAKQMLTNIDVYRDTMAQAAALEHKKDLHGAERKYEFAAVIKPDGPGHPGDRLREVRAMEAQASAAELTATTAKQTSTQIVPPQKTIAPQLQPGRAAQVKNILNAGRRAEAKGDLKNALSAYENALRLDKRQPEAAAGEQRVMAELRSAPEKQENNLKQGIADFYASDFSRANEAIGDYLQGSTLRYGGAAHFYAGASLLSQALLVAPEDEAHVDGLRKEAREQFALARQARYKPVEGAVSPKILVLWAEVQ